MDHDGSRSDGTAHDGSRSDGTAHDGLDQDRAQLASVASSLAELTERLVAIADRHRSDPSGTISPDLDEVERSLRSATRKLGRLVHRLR